mmetsp:Transcript_25733/g.66270  ORF Transcript_25733/g.66270 Transcript_25733/m.66270 type:complete len:350 (-) Transcript_25733:129-1178(-)
MEAVKSALHEVDTFVRSPEFQRRSVDFVDSNCDVFEFAEENKLEYTEIHKRYQDEVEAYLLENLEGVDMELLVGKLPDLIKQGYEMDAESAKTLDLLTNFGDFETFKEMMLTAKQDHLAKAGNVSANSTISASELMQVEGCEKYLAELSAAMEGQGEWATVADKGWYKVELKQADGGQELMRSAIQIDMSPADVLQMLLSYGKPEMGQWIEMVESTRIIKEYSPNDYIVELDIALSGIMSIVAVGVPKSLTIRIVTRPDFPEKGDYSVVSMPWDVDANAMAAASMMKIKASCIRPVPGQPDKTLMTSLAPKSGGAWVPSWALRAMYSHWGPKHVTGMVTKFKKFKATEE